MANLTEAATFDSNIYRIDENDPVQGWDGSSLGIANQQAQALANRTQWLKARVDLGARFTAVNIFAPASSGQVQPLTPTDLKGSLMRVNTSAFDGVLTLPLANSCDDGSSITITNEPGLNVQFIASNGRGVVIGISGSDTILDVNSNTAASSYTVHPYTIVKLHKISSTQWLLWKEESAEFCPPGIIMPWAVNSQPYGWLECNGSAISRANYARLFANIGTKFGVGNGSTTFNIPDLRGEFIRGWDNGRGVDTNVYTVTATLANGNTLVVLTGGTTTAGLFPGMSVTGTLIAPGTTIVSIGSSSQFTMSAGATGAGTGQTLTISGRMFGSTQADEFKSHFHIMKKFNRSVGAGAGFFAMDDSGTDGSENTELTGGAETRPRNIALMLCIKY